MNREIAVAADRLARAVRESGPCGDNPEEDECCTPRLQEAATELLEELWRAGVTERTA